MDSFDREEECELVGLYFKDILKNEFGDNKISLYRDDEVSCFQNLTGPESAQIKKNVCKIFKQPGLNITGECKLRITDFLDITFDLQ